MSTLPHPTRHSYLTVLSALRKADLIQLSLELRLPTDGSIINLRNHLRCYLNFNYGMLAQNPRYAALFLNHRCTNQPLASQHSSNTLCMSPPALSYHDPSLTPSFASWHGIKDEPCSNQLHSSPQLQQHLPLQAPLASPSLPSSPFSGHGSDHGPTPSLFDAPVGCKSSFPTFRLFFFTLFLSSLPDTMHSTIIVDTMKSCITTLCSHSMDTIKSFFFF